jgi:hypothetical protein
MAVQGWLKGRVKHGQPHRGFGPSLAANTNDGFARESARTGSEPTGRACGSSGKTVSRVALLHEFAKLRSQLAISFYEKEGEATMWCGWAV